MRRLVLVGGGHAQIFVIEAFGLAPEPGVEVVLVTRDLEAPYSGMVPGAVAGFYTHGEAMIDLAALCHARGAALIHAEATGFDAARKLVMFGDREPLAYDVLSINIGITPDLAQIAGADANAVAVKPIQGLLERFEAVRSDAMRADGPRRIAVVGGGAAGTELALSIAARLRRDGKAAGIATDAFRVVVLAAEGIVPTSNARVQTALRRALAKAGIAVRDGFRAVTIEPGRVLARDGREEPADAVFVSTRAAPPACLAASDLARTEQGFLAIRPTLQVTREDDVFAAGDCATMVDTPREKAGVFAVRQGPPLAANLRARLRCEAPAPHVPQKDYLYLVGTGDGRAIGGRGSWLKIEGTWVWWLKDWIDRRFMKRFQA